MKPQKYIAFLRAVNVGGRVVKMERLRELFEELGLATVRSYIQSGNVFFETTGKDTKASRAALQLKLEKHLEAELGFKVPVFLRTADELEAALTPNPFKAVNVTDDTRLLVLFTSGALPKGTELPVSSPKGDATIIAANPGELFVVAVNQNGRPGNPAAWVEKSFGLKVTGRFYHTAEKILKAARSE